MAAITVRNIEDDLKLKLRRKAAANNRSMEAEVRAALRNWVSPVASRSSLGLGTLIRREVERLGGGVEFDLPADEQYEPPVLDRR